MSDIVEFLSARLDEDSALADKQDLLRAGEPYPDGSGIADNDAFPHYPWGYRPEGEPEFMAGPGHPARVLAEVVAKRAILAEHVNQFADDDPFPRCIVDGNWPCSTLLALASVYADHPDFDPAWKVEQ